jgi:GNAT superfamily N-acetyltransferase
MIRRARAAESDMVRDVVLSAYRRYVAVIGTEPGPMLDDYAALIAADQVWVLEDTAGIAGALVLQDGPDCFLLDNVAIRPDRQGRGFGRGRTMRVGDDHTLHELANDRKHRDLRGARICRTGTSDREGVRPGLYG